MSIKVEKRYIDEELRDRSGTEAIAEVQRIARTTVE
jgi:hypothetical protein